MSTCAAVLFDEARKSDEFPELEVGDELWSYKDGGHVIVELVRCGEKTSAGHTADCGCGGYPSGQPCTATSAICECGQDNGWRDHHYVYLKPSQSDSAA